VSTTNPGIDATTPIFIALCSHECMSYGLVLAMTAMTML